MVTDGSKTVTRSVTRSTVKQDVEMYKTYITRSVLGNTDVHGISPKAKKNVVFVDKDDVKKNEGDRNLSIVSDEGVGDLGPVYSLPGSSLLSSIPPMLVRPKHPLKNAWTLWYYRNDRSLSWEDNQQPVATVATIEEFWQLHQLLQPASKLSLGCDYSLFRAGIVPDWEDPANVGGGRWIYKPSRAQLDEAWLELLVFLIGEHADDQASQVNGAVVNLRKRSDKLAVWMKNARDMVTVVDVGRQVRNRLVLRPYAKIQFSVHREERERANGFNGERLPEILL